MRRTMKIAATLVALIAVGACSSGPKPASARCEPVSIDRAAQILGTSSGVTAEKAGAVRSTEHEKAWYVAIRFTGPGVEDGEVGVWATNDLGSGSVVSVDAFAEEFSGILKDTRFSTTDEGADEARTCV